MVCYSYYASDAVLNMKQEEDYLCVFGDFYVQSNQSHSGKLTDGILEVKGDFIQKNASTTRNFCATKNHKVMLSGDKLQRMEFESNKLSGSKIMNLELTNLSADGIQFVNRPYVVGVVKDQSVYCSGEISIGSQTTFEGNYFSGSIYTIASTAISKPLQINGDVVVNYHMTIYDTLDVKGNVVCTEDCIEFAEGTLRVGGDFESHYSTENYGLKMTHENDHMIVKGDFKYSAYDTLEMTAGVIEVSGNISIEKGFVATLSHRFVLNGEDAQRIEMNSNNAFAVLEFINESTDGVCIGTYLYYKELIENNTKITYAANMLVEDKVVEGDFELTQDGYQINGKTLVIRGDYVQNTGVLQIQSGNVIVTGNLYLSGGSIALENGTLSVSGNMIQSNTGTLIMKEKEDRVTVYQNYELTTETDSSGLFTDGILEIKGNFTQTDKDTSKNYAPSDNHTLVLSGDGKQIITLGNSEINTIDENSYINNIVMCNKSVEGIQFINQPIVLGTIDAQEENIEGSIRIIEESQALFVNNIYGGDVWWDKFNVATENEKIHILGDFDVMNKTVSLENNLVVDGNVAVTQGEIRLNDYRMDVGGNLYVKSAQGSRADGLSMYQENSYIAVKGDFIYDSYYTNSSYLRNGTIEIKGNVQLVKNFRTQDNFRLLLSGQERQELELNSTSKIAILELTNTSEAGVISEYYFEPDEMILNDSKLIFGAGNENAIMGYTLTEDTVISGDLYLMLGTLDLNGHSLTVEGNFIQAFGDVHINGGQLLVYGNYLSEFRKGTPDTGYTSTDGKGTLIMNNPQDYVYIYGDLVWGTIYSHEGLLTDGVLELQGNLKLFSQRYLIASENHTFKLSGKKTEDGTLYNQSIAYNSGFMFHKLVLTKPLKEGYTFSESPEFICKELVYEYEDVTPPQSITMLEVLEIGMDTVTIRYDGAKDESKIISYCICRNGEKIAEVSEKEYTDRYLIPNDTYTYEVYAVDEFRNCAKESIALQVNTLKDEVIPDTVTGLYIKSLSASSVTLAWEKSSDNVGIAGYKIYRDGEFLSDNGANVIFKDLTVNDYLEHSYQITAYDTCGNESEKSEILYAMPEATYIESMTPDAAFEIGKGVTSFKAKVLYNIPLRTSSYMFEYKEKGTQEWKMITQSKYFQVSGERDELGQWKDVAYASCSLDGSTIEADSVEIRFSVIDEDQNVDSVTYEYFFDVTAPQPVKKFDVQCNDSVVKLTWQESTSSDCESYNVYRMEEGETDYTELCQLTATETEYLDKDAKEGQTYTYCIETVDKHGLKSELSEKITIVVSKDEEKPVIHQIDVFSYQSNGNLKIYVTATDNQIVSKVTIYAREQGNDRWEVLKTDENIFMLEEFFTHKHAIIPDADYFHDGIYELSFVAEDASGNLSKRSESVFVSMDKTAPSKVMNVRAKKIGAKYVQLTWDEMAEDVSYYQIEQMEDGMIRKSEKRGSNLCNWQGLEAETTYTFRVVAYDSVGNRGVESEEILIQTMADDIKPKIEMIGTENKKYSKQMKLSLTASDNQELGKCVFSYSLDKVNYTMLTEVLCEQGMNKETYEYEWDVTSLPEGEIDIKYEVYDKYGNHNKLIDNKEVISTYQIDHTAPEKVKDLKAEDYGGCIALSWSEVKDAYSYSIYRAEATKNQFSFVKNTTITNYVDRNVAENTAYIYKVIALDDAENYSEDSDNVVVTASKDHTCPVVEGSSISDNTILKANPTLKFIVTDNNCLDSVKIEYSKANDSVRNFVTIIEKNIEDNFCLIEEAWDTTGLESGEYLIKVTITDTSGNENKSTIYKCMLDTIPPVNTKLSAKKVEGTIRLEFCSNKEEDFSYYEIIRKTKTKSKNNEQIEAGETLEERFVISDKSQEYYIDDTVEPETSYEYIIRGYDECGNYSDSEAVWITTGEEDYKVPEISLSDYTGKIGEVINFYGDRSVDNVGIARYEWDMGDGTVLHEKNPQYIYENEGEYPITLTVVDYSGNESSTTQNITIYNEDCGLCVVEVLDENGCGIENATVYIKEMPDSVFMTAADGTFLFYAKEGTYTAAAYADNYKISEFTIQIHEQGQTNTTVTLRSGTLIYGDIEVKKLTLEEALEKDIDLANPDNYFSYEFKLSAAFQEQPTNVSYLQINVHSAGSGGGSIHKDKDKNIWDDKEEEEEKEEEDKTPNLTAVQTKEGPVIIYFNSEAASVSWLKDIYQVDLSFCTFFSEFCELSNVMAELELTEGISLAQTVTGQKLNVAFENMSNSDKREATWYIKGDAYGEYDLRAQVQGILMPFGTKISQKVACQQKIEMKSGEGLHLYIYPESQMYMGDTYYIQYALVNESKRTFYNVTTKFGKYRTPLQIKEVKVYFEGEYIKTITEVGGVAYRASDVVKANKTPILCSGDSLTVEKFKPGESICGTFAHPYGLDSESDNSYYEMIKVLVNELGDTNTGLKVTIHPIASHLKRSSLKIRIVNNNNLVQNMNTKIEVVSEPKAVEDPISMTSGAFITRSCLMNVLGVREINFNMNYDSTQTQSNGDLGYGWYHDYESKIKDYGNFLEFWIDPITKIPFESETGLERVVNGAYQDGVVYIDGYTVSDNQVSMNSLEERTVEEGTLGEEEFNNKEILYIPLGASLKGYEIRKNADGYLVSMPDGSEKLFDIHGTLIQEKNNNGQIVNIVHSEQEIILTEPVSGHFIKGIYDENKRIVRLVDNAKNEVAFSYDRQGNMQSVTSKTGTTNYYAYDVNHRILVGRDTNKKVYVVNTYDDNGRVLTQDDGDETTSVVKIKYEDNEEDETTTITITDRQGIESRYINTYEGYNLSMTDKIGGTIQKEYDEAGRMIKYVPANGESILYSYDENGNVTKEEHTSGKVTEYLYDEANNLIHQSGNDGTSVDYTYDENHLLLSMQSGNGLHATYTYNENGQLVSESIGEKGSMTYTYENGLVKTVTDYNGNTTTIEYDEIGNVISKTDGNGIVTDYTLDANGRVLAESVHLADGSMATTEYTYDAYGNKISQKDANGNDTTYQYDDNNNMIKETKADGSSIEYAYNLDGQVVKVTYPENVSIENNYDAAGNLLSVINTLKGTTKQEYNNASQLLNTTLPNGGVVTYTYYSNGLLHTQTDANGIVTEYTYDTAGRISSVTKGRMKNTYTYDTAGNLQSVSNALGETIFYEYNELRQVVKMTDANGNQTLYDYDVFGNCIQTTDALSHITQYQYNSANEIVKVTQKGENGNADHTMKYEYDNLGNVTAITDAKGSVYRMKYDSVGNLLEVYDALGNKIQSYTYDLVYNVISTENAVGLVTTFEYDKLGNVVREMNQNSGSVATYQYIGGQLIRSATDAMDGKTSVSYNSVGDIVSFANPNGGVTNYTYDLNGNKLSESIGDDYKLIYTYNDMDLVETKVNSKGQKTVYEYDKAGRMISLTDELGTIEYTYDKNGNVLTVTDEYGTIKREYDALNRVISYTDTKGNHIGYDYDEFGNLVCMTYPDGSTIQYTYDEINNLTAVTDQNGKVTVCAYDANGRLIKTVRPNGTTETRAYDAAGQLTSILDKKGETVINEQHYTYDLNGNIVKTTSQTGQTEQNQSVLYQADMEYDTNNRLVKYNGQQVIYDADGNMIYGPLDGQMTTFVYDCRNRLIQAGNTKYEYDAENHRTTVIKHADTANEERTEFVVDSVQELSRILQSKTYQQDNLKESLTYVYGNGLLAQYADNETTTATKYLYYHFNNVGSTMAVTDANGELKYRYAYSAYGELLSGSYGQVLFLYNGQYGVASDDNGLYYMRARYYNISIKRFINQDVLTGEVKESQSLNRYAYVEGNPVTYLDPFGLEKSETSFAHDVLAVIGITAFGIGLVATGGLSYIMYGVGAISSGFNAGLCLYDVGEAETAEEYGNALVGFGFSLLGIGTGGLVLSAGEDLIGFLIYIEDGGINLYNFYSEFQ